MKSLQEELRQLSDNALDMWELVASQLENTRNALIDFDNTIANEVIAKEKRVDAYELRIDKECESLIALKNPFAADLRFVLAILKINYNLERIGDFANGICLMILDLKEPIKKEYFKKLQVLEMFQTCLDMLTIASDSLHTEDGKLARKIFEMDRFLDEANHAAPDIVCEIVKDKPENLRVILDVLLVVRRLERVGDQMTNIVEEIIFYIEAKKLMHKKFKKKISPPSDKDDE